MRLVPIRTDFPTKITTPVAEFVYVNPEHVVRVERTSDTTVEIELVTGRCFEAVSHRPEDNADLLYSVIARLSS